MLLEIYLFLTALAYITLIIGLTTKRDIEGQGIKSRGSIPLLLISVVLFFILAKSSMDIDYYTCENQVLWMNQSATNENDTQISNTIGCDTQKIKSSPLSWLNNGLGILAALMTILITLFEFTKSPETRPLR